MVKIKCDNCNKKFNVTLEDAFAREVDFDGQDDLLFTCPKCGKTVYANYYTVRDSPNKKSFWDILNGW